MVDTYGTGKVADEKLADCVREIFPVKPADLIRHLGLLSGNVTYRNTAAYGHFGRPEFPWENTDKATDVAGFVGL